MVTKSGLGVGVGRRQARDVAVLLWSRVQRRRGFNAGVSYDRAGWKHGLRIPLEHHGRQIVSSLRDIGTGGARIAVGGRLSLSADGFDGREGGGDTGIGLGGYRGRFLPGGFRKELLHVLVAAMRGAPVRILEWTRDTRDVKLVQKLLMSFTFGRSRDHAGFWSWGLMDRESVDEK